jgi:hypothetical protein
MYGAGIFRKMSWGQVYVPSDEPNGRIKWIGRFSHSRITLS